MTAPHRHSAFIFRRDLRLQDNTALREAFRRSETVLLCFVFDPRQIEPHPYRSEPALQYMVESLDELAVDVREAGGRLYFFVGHAEQIVERLLGEAGVEAVFVNEDYTPFSKQRDAKIEAVCQERGASFYSFADALLAPPGAVLTQAGQPYHVFTHFFRNARSLDVQSPDLSPPGRMTTRPIAFESDDSVLARVLPSRNPNRFVEGGRNAAVRLLATIRRLGNYAEERNIPALTGTTGLSACNKFGVCSIREVHAQVVEQFGRDHTLITELHWRDFFTHLAHHYPRVFEGPFDRRYERLSWENDDERFEAFCEGRTGYPIVDAGIRQLLSTGYMHNRVRMIVASFLTKDLHIDWRWGERFFAQHLIDYDPCVNNGNWQWAASTGADAQPFFRIFSPWAQQRKFDPDAEYVRQWVDELRSLAPEEVHALEKDSSRTPNSYVRPIVDHRVESARAKERYRRAAAR